MDNWRAGWSEPAPPHRLLEWMRLRDMGNFTLMVTEAKKYGS